MFPEMRKMRQNVVMQYLVLHGDAMSCSTKYYNFVLKMFVQELAIRKKGSLGKQNVTIVKANLNRENTFSKVLLGRPGVGRV